MSGKYILQDGKPVQANDLFVWAYWFEHADQERIVAQTNLGHCRVSTVFLGLDHNWGDGPPLLFETVVFDGEYDQYQDRYSTWEEAEAGHAGIVEMCKHVGP